MKTKGILISATMVISGIAYAATGTWDTDTLTTTTEVTAVPTGAGIVVSNALTTLNAAATGSDGSLVTSSVLSDAGLTNVVGIYLSDYQSAFSSASGISGLSAAQAVINTANADAAPIALTPPVPTPPVENSLYNFATPASSYFTGTGALTLTASGLPSWLSFDGTSFSGTPTVAADHMVTITATDGAGASASSSVTFSITNVNDAPVLSDTSLTIAENLSAGASVGSVTGTDEDGDALTWSLSGTGASNFVISSSGVVSVASGASLDFETTPSYTISASATDGSGSSDNAAVTITLNNVDEGGPVFASTTPTSATHIPGNAPLIHTFSATDPDNDAISYSSLTPGFSIDGVSGALTATTAASGSTNAVVVTATANGVTANHTISVVVHGAADSIADASASVTSTQLTGVVSSDVLSDLTSNSNCGVGGATNCLDAFNAAKASSSCVLDGGSAATGTQVSTYVDCVMREVNIASIATLPTSNPSTSSVNSCTAIINMPMPGFCAHPQWDCSFVGTKTPSTGLSLLNNNSEASLSATLNGAPSAASYTIRASLGIYSPAYTRDYSYNVTIPGTAPSGTVVAQYSYNGGSNIAWNSCLAKGGILSTAAEIRAYKNWGSTWPNGYNSDGLSWVAFRNDSSVGRTYAHSCSGWTATKISKVNFRPSTSNPYSVSIDNYRNQSNQHLKYIDSNGVTQNSSCRDPGSSGSGNYFCTEPAYSCN